MIPRLRPRRLDGTGPKAIISSSTPACTSCRAGRCATPLLPAAAGSPCRPGRPPARYKRGREQLVQRQTATVRAGDGIVSPHQCLERRPTITTAILIDRHRPFSFLDDVPFPPDSDLWRVRRRAGRATGSACRQTIQPTVVLCRDCDTPGSLLV